MALDKNYFDEISLEVVKKKYYNAKKVRAVLADIQRQAEELTAENERMHQALSALADRRVELGDAMLSGQGVYRGIIDKANVRADRIMQEAKHRADELVAETQRQQDEAVQRVERLFTTMKAQHQAAIDTLNTEWQDYLCSLYPEQQEAAPEDLGEKVDAIARELFAINDDESEDDEESEDGREAPEPEADEERENGDCCEE